VDNLLILQEGVLAAYGPKEQVMAQLQKSAPPVAPQPPPVKTVTVTV